MRVEHPHHRQPCAVAGAGHADTAVVVRHVLQQPFDRVVGVGAFIDGLVVLRIARLPEHDELPFGLESPANVLADDDVSICVNSGNAAASRAELKSPIPYGVLSSKIGSFSAALDGV